MRVTIRKLAPLLLSVAQGLACAATDDGKGAAAGGGGMAGATTSSGGGAGALPVAGGAAGGVSSAQGGNPSGGVGGGGSTTTAGTAPMSQAGDAGAPTAALPSGVPANYRLLLDEPFADKASLARILAGNPEDWTHSDEGGGFLQFAGVGYAPPNPPIPESFTSFALVSGFKFGSFVLEVELMQRNPQQDIPQRDLCIVFNIQSETEYYYAHIAQGHTDRWHNIHIIDNAPRRPITVTNNGGIDWGLDEWHKLRVVRDVMTGAIAVYMDDDLTAPILTASDTTFQQGYVGFATHQDSGRIRNLKVWGVSAIEEKAPATFFE